MWGILGEYNRTNLSGAIDIVVVEHEDGSFKSTPFHVRFGKFRLLRSNRKKVKIKINGEAVALSMYLGLAGEAYFCDPDNATDLKKPETRKQLFDMMEEEDKKGSKSFWSWGWGGMPHRKEADKEQRRRMPQGIPSGQLENSMTKSMPVLPNFSEDEEVKQALPSGSREEGDEPLKSFASIPSSPLTASALSRIFKSSSVQKKQREEKASAGKPVQPIYRIKSIDEELFMSFIEEGKALRKQKGETDDEEESEYSEFSELSECSAEFIIGDKGTATPGATASTGKSGGKTAGHTFANDSTESNGFNGTVGAQKRREPSADSAVSGPSCAGNSGPRRPRVSTSNPCGFTHFESDDDDPHDDEEERYDHQQLAGKETPTGAAGTQTTATIPTSSYSSSANTSAAAGTVVPDHRQQILSVRYEAEDSDDEYEDEFFEFEDAHVGVFRFEEEELLAQEDVEEEEFKIPRVDSLRASAGGDLTGQSGDYSPARERRTEIHGSRSSIAPAVNGERDGDINNCGGAGELHRGYTSVGGGKRRERDQGTKSVCFADDLPAPSTDHTTCSALLVAADKSADISPPPGVMKKACCASACPKKATPGKGTANAQLASVTQWQTKGTTNNSACGKGTETCSGSAPHTLPEEGNTLSPSSTRRPTILATTPKKSSTVVTASGKSKGNLGIQKGEDVEPSSEDTTLGDVGRDASSSLEMESHWMEHRLQRELLRLEMKQQQEQKANNTEKEGNKRQQGTPGKQGARGLNSSTDAVSVELSLCRGALEKLAEAAKDTQSNIDCVWEDHRVSSEDFQVQPELLWDKDLIFKINENMYPTSIACPIIVSYVAFGKPLPPSIVEMLNDEMAAAKPKEESWWGRFWSSSSANNTKTPSSGSMRARSSVSASPALRRRRAGSASALPKVVELPEASRSLKPTSEQLAALPLRPGKNVITFTVDSELRGEQEVSAFIYLWDSNTEIVISDIDGTITRSDLFGHIMPILGRDWSHSGVAQLYSNIYHNGYKLLYLSSRPIGQAGRTRGYISTLRQDDVSLPEGPIFTSPDGLIDSLNREVILRKPQEFKIACLEDISDTFGKTKNPFKAGFGNRSTDVVSYKAVGVPSGKIFIINPQGELTTMNMELTYKKSYVTLNELVDEVFPALDTAGIHEEFNSFQYWSTPIPSLESLPDIT